MMQAYPKPKRLKRPGHNTSVAAISATTHEGAVSHHFELEYMPVDKIKRRVLHPSSVHYSLPSHCWIATIYRLPDSHSSEQHRARYSQFEFALEADAKQFAKAYSPPKMDELNDNCFICKDVFNAKLRALNCRNCGVW